MAGVKGRSGSKPGSNNGGGRKPGTPNRLTAERIARVQKAVESGITPLEFFLKSLNSPPIAKLKDEDEDDFQRRQREDFAIRLDCAKAAAPYIHPKLATTEIKQDPPPAPPEAKVDIVDLARKIAFIFSKAEARMRA